MATPKSYGICYMGSKNALAERIVALLPSASHLIDVFAGGCAITHCAMKSGKWQHVHANDLNEMIVGAFRRAINGGFIGERRWVSREEFNRVRDTDAYAAICFCFGGNCSNYAYSPKKEELKRALHSAIFFGDPAPFRSFTGIDLTPVLTISDLRERYLTAKQLSRENGKRIVLQPFVSLNRLNSLATAFTNEEKNRLTIGSVDFAEVEIPNDSVIYCDPPYRGTSSYSKATRFDHDRFYEWALRQAVPVFVSEYEMPDEFLEVSSWQKLCKIKPTSNNLRTTEKLFVPRWQAKELGFRTE